MEKVINFGVPHIAENIFERIGTPGLIKCLEVSPTWKTLAENVLLKRWKGKMLEACQNGETKIVQLLLENYNSEESGLNTRKNRWTGLMWACTYGHRDIVQLLLKHHERIELNAKTNGGTTAFILACYFRHISRCCQIVSGSL